MRPLSAPIFRRRGVPALALALLAAGLAAAATETPAPPRRPAELAPAPTIPLPPTRPDRFSAPVSEAEDRETAPACARLLASGHVVASVAEAIIGPGGCGIAAPVTLEAIVLADGRHVALEPRALMRCELAEAIADWVREDIAPLAEKAGAGLATILGSNGYQCRGRNGVAGATLSEHGKGGAYDLRGVVLRDGRTLAVERQDDALDVMESLRGGACARFPTVLGPGSDGFHETHAHVDLEARGNGYRICQWEIR